MTLCKVGKFAAAALGSIAVLYLAAGFALSRGKQLGEQHVDFDEPPFDYNSDSFDDYILYSQARILAARVGVLDRVMLDNLAPFELQPAAECPRTADGKAERGIVLTHGLLESAYTMRELGEFLQQQCFHVLGLLLPDHGSRPGDFLSTDWHEYAAAVAFATRVLQNRAERIVLGGHSIGGSLSILEASRNEAVDALLLFAPALAITDVARFARFIVPLGKLFPGAAWVDVAREEALYRYESLSYTAAAQTWDLLAELRKAENARVQSLPVFTVASVEDSTVSTPAILEFMQRNTNPASLTLLYSQHGHPGGERIKVQPSTDREQGILSLSHLGLMIAPENPHYGRDGLYRSCGHHGPADHPDFIACRAGERDWYGETTPDNRAAGLLARITFNPYHAALLQDIGLFLQAL
jgi:alpha-beta hydrolase superfamily lysophospholipase